MGVLAKAPARDLSASQGVRGGCPRACLVGDELLGTWRAGGAVSALELLRVQSRRREQQAQGSRYQRPEAPEGRACFIKTKRRVSLKIPLLPRFPSRLLLWSHMFPMNPHSSEFRSTNNSIQLFGGREFLRDEVMVWLQ